MDNLIKNVQIGNIVAENYKTASVFKQFGIDFCCNGQRTISEACEEKDLSHQLVLDAVNNILSSKTSESIDYNSWPIDLLIDYILKKHHRYVESASIELLSYTTKIAKVHGNAHPELIEINSLFNDVVKDLASHMKKEELILFPFIRRMIHAKESNEAIEAAHFGSVKNPINMMHLEHDNAGDMFKQINLLSNNYTLPKDACTTYTVCFKMLEEFDDDLHLHVHLENNILFPKALSLYNDLNTRGLIK